MTTYTLPPTGAGPEYSARKIDVTDAARELWQRIASPSWHVIAAAPEAPFLTMLRAGAKQFEEFTFAAEQIRVVCVHEQTMTHQDLHALLIATGETAYVVATVVIPGDSHPAITRALHRLLRHVPECEGAAAAQPLWHIGPRQTFIDPSGGGIDGLIAPDHAARMAPQLAALAFPAIFRGVH